MKKKKWIYEVCKSFCVVFTQYSHILGIVVVLRIEVVEMNFHFSQVFEITLSRGYSESSFREDLKTLYLRLGIENKKIVFLFTDTHVAEEGFLELINDMLTSGWILIDLQVIYHSQS